MVTPKPLSKVFSHDASHTASAIPLDLAFVLDKAIVRCFFLLYVIIPLPIEKAYLLVDILSL